MHLFWILTRYFFRLSRRHLEPVPTCSHTHGILVECCGDPSDSSWAARTIDYFFRRNESADVSLSRYRHPEIWDQKTPKSKNSFSKIWKIKILYFVSVYFQHIQGWFMRVVYNHNERKPPLDMLEIHRNKVGNYIFRVFDEFSGFWCLLISDLRMAVPG